MATDSVQIPQIYQALYTSKKRYFLLTGGRGSLKSSTVHDFVARLTYEAGHGVLFTRYTMTSAEKSIIPEFEITLDRLGVKHDFHITKNLITNRHTGSFIYFSGIKTTSGDQTANLKSIAGITTWVIEEGEDFKDERAFDTIDDSIRTAQKQNRIIWIQNPTTDDHFIYRRWIDPANKRVDIEGFKVTVSTLEHVEHIHSTYHVAEALGYLSGDWLDKAHQARDKAAKMDDPNKSWYFHNYIGGWLDKAEGAIFENWEEGEFPKGGIYCYGLDLGYYPDPLAMIQISVDRRRKRIYAKECMYELKLSTEQVVERVRWCLARKMDLIVCDTSEVRLYAEMRNKGLNMAMAVKSPGSIAQDIREMQDYTIIVDPNSANLKRELNNYAWNDKKASIPIDAYNHLIDAMRYAYRRLSGYRTKGVRSMNR